MIASIRLVSKGRAGFTTAIRKGISSSSQCGDKAAMFLAIMAAMLSLQSAAATQQRQSIPTRQIASLVGDNDYPRDAMQRRAQGVVTFMLTIDVDGVPVDCRIDGRADPALDRRTCEIFRSRARFHPARDAEGRAVAGYYPGRMRWLLPVGRGGFATGGVLGVTSVRRNAAGELACSVTVNGREDPNPRIRSCEQVQEPAMINAIRALGHEAELTLVFMIEPEGMILRGRTPPDSEPLIAESVARLTVAEGRVEECRMTSRRAPRPITGVETAPDLCTLFPAGADFPGMAGRRGGRQTVWIDSRFHLREGARPSP